MPDLVVRNCLAPLIVSDRLAPKLPDFKAGDRVKFRASVTGGNHAAMVIRSRYSPFYESWLYDIKITGDRSAIYPRGSEHSSIAESQLRSRLF